MMHKTDIHKFDSLTVNKLLGLLWSVLVLYHKFNDDSLM